MSTTIAQIRAGLVTNIKTDASIAAAFQVSAYMLGDPTPPCIWIYPDAVDYHEAMQSGLNKQTFVVHAFVGAAADEGAQLVLDQLLAEKGAYSVRAAVESDVTLGGIVDDVTVISCTGYQVYESPHLGRSFTAAQMLGAQWMVEVVLTP